MQRSSKRRPGRILIRTYPVAKYLAVLLIPLSLYRLSPVTWLLPDITGARVFQHKFYSPGTSLMTKRSLPRG